MVDESGKVDANANDSKNNDNNGNNNNDNKHIISRKQFLKLLVSGAIIMFFGGFLRPVFEMFIFNNNNNALAQQKEETLLIVYPVPGFPLPPNNFVVPHDPTKFGIPNYDPDTGESSERIRGMPWGHTIVIKGKLVKAADPKKGVARKEVVAGNSYGPRPRTIRRVDDRYDIIAITDSKPSDKNGKFIAFVRNTRLIDQAYGKPHYQYAEVRNKPYYNIDLAFMGTVDDDYSVDPQYYNSNTATVYHHSLVHRTSLTVKLDSPDSNITPGQLLTFTATLRDEDGVFVRNGIEPNAYFNVEDVDSIDITSDPLKGVLVHEMEGRKIEFTGTGIVPIKDERGIENITTAVTDKNGVATFKAFAPNTVGQNWTYQAHYKALGNEHPHIEDPNEPSKNTIENKTDEDYFFDASSPVMTFTSKPQEWFDRSQGMQPVRNGNMVIGLIDGPETFSSMVNAITTARNVGHYIYMLNWWMDLNFELIPGNIPPGGARSTRLYPLLANAVTKGAQVRAMLWDQVGTQNSEEVRLINLLADGAAILDNNMINPIRAFGSHHQKILIVKGEKGLICFCGGIDFHPDRITVTRDPGTPQHDVHCRIEGPAAWDLLQIFNQRWTDHPDSGNLDIKKGILRGLGEPMPSPSIGSMQVQIGRTYGNGSVHPGIRNKSGQRFYSFAPTGERTAERMIFHAIRQAQSFIYIEDQYLISMDASNVLRAQLPKIQYLVILISHSSVSDLPRRWELRKNFIDNLRADPNTRDKVVICYRKPAGAAPNPARVDPAAQHTRVHSKMFIFDDKFAIIGSANCNSRSYTHDSEVVAGILGNVESEMNFAKELRIRLWQEHLNLTRSDVTDPLTSARYWFSPAVSSSVGIYDQNAATDSIAQKRISPSIIDPFGG